MSAATPSPAPAAGGVLRIRAFRRLWLALSLSSLGDWLTLLAVTVLANRLAGDGYAAQNYAVAGVLLLRLLPAIVLAPFAGVVADRVDRRTVLVCGDLLRCGLVASIPLVGTLWWLLVAAALIETVSLFWLPAKEATVPNLVPRARLEAANSLSLLTTYGTAPVAALLFSVLALSGGVTGRSGPLLGADPVDLALFLDAATFLLSALTIARLRDIPRGPAQGTGGTHVVAAVLEGWRFVGRTPLLRGLVVGLVGAFGAGGVVIGLARSYVADFAAGDAGYGLLFAAVFLGIAFGVALGPRLPASVSRRRLCGVCLSIAGVSLVGVSLAQHIAVAVAATVVLGGFTGLAWVSGLTLLGREVHDSLRGRTFAFMQALVRVVLAGVLALAPLLAGSIGVRQVRLGDAALTFSGAALTMLIGGLLATGMGLVALRLMDDSREPASGQRLVGAGSPGRQR